MLFYKFRVFCFRQAGYKIGKQVYIGEDLIICDELEDRGNIVIGDRVAIAERVTLVSSSSPNFSRIRSIAPITEGPITIENDAWIGTGVIVLSNVIIGEGAIVGAGSLVNRNVPPYTVVVGLPARPIRRLNHTKITNNVDDNL